MKRILAVIIVSLLPVNVQANQRLTMYGMNIICDPKKGYFELIPQPDIGHKISGPLKIIKDEKRMDKVGNFIEDEKLFSAECDVGKGITFAVQYHSTGRKYVGLLSLWYGRENIIVGEDVVGEEYNYSDVLYHLEIKNYFLKYSIIYNGTEEIKCTDYGLDLKRKDLKKILKKISDLSNPWIANENPEEILRKYYDYYNSYDLQVDTECDKAVKYRTGY